MLDLRTSPWQVRVSGGARVRILRTGGAVDLSMSLRPSVGTCGDIITFIASTIAFDILVTARSPDVGDHDSTPAERSQPRMHAVRG